MDQFERLILLAELDGEVCGLNHGREEKGTIHKAHDYLVVPFGPQKKDGKKNAPKKELVIPICSECIEALRGDEWTLLYCFECG